MSDPRQRRPREVGDEVRRLAGDLGRRFDPSSAANIEAMRAFYDAHPIVSVLAGLAGAVLGGEEFRTAVEALARYDASMVSLAESTLLFTERGWVVSKHVPTDGYREVIELRREGAGDDDVDVALTEVWNRPAGPLEHLAARLKVLGAADAGLAAVAAQRARLAELAWAHHQAGAYEASIPIVLAQIDGIIHDATVSPDWPKGRTFFSKKSSKADVLDDDTVAGIEYGLTAVRDWFSSEVASSGSHGGGSRHGVLHGRDLTYDTKVNSTKCFVLLLAVWEWANRRLGEEADRRKEERYAEYAESDEVDDNGWRLDRRGFTETRSRLRVLGHLEQQHRREHGRFATGFELVAYPPVLRQLQVAELLDIDVEVGTNAYSASLRSASSWVFAIGACGDTAYYYDDRRPPPGLPPAPGWRTTDDGNWSGDCYW